MQKPSVGRVVHYVSYGTPGGEFGRECRAAVVTEVVRGEEAEQAERVSLAILNPGGMFFHAADHLEVDDNMPHPAERLKGGTWHWPERVE